MCKCTGQSLSVHTHTWARGETRFKCAHSLWARAAYVRARESGFVQEQRKSAREQGDSRASREIRARAKEIRARAGRFALAHYINLLSRYKNVLSTFGSKITPYWGSKAILITIHAGKCSAEQCGYTAAVHRLLHDPLTPCRL